MMYYVLIPATPNPVREPGETVELFRSEDYAMAKSVADDHKTNTGTNASVESRATVYTTQTLDEAMGAPRKTLADRSRKNTPEARLADAAIRPGAASGFNLGKLVGPRGSGDDDGPMATYRGPY
jgi:hypothetical protein